MTRNVRSAVRKEQMQRIHTRSQEPTVMDLTMLPEAMEVMTESPTADPADPIAVQAVPLTTEADHPAATIKTSLPTVETARSLTENHPEATAVTAVPAAPVLPTARTDHPAATIKTSLPTVETARSLTGSHPEVTAVTAVLAEADLPTGESPRMHIVPPRADTAHASRQAVPADLIPTAAAG
jgi:hypothetical protein